MEEAIGGMVRGRHVEMTLGAIARQHCDHDAQMAGQLALAAGDEKGGVELVVGQVIGHGAHPGRRRDGWHVWRAGRPRKR